MFSSPRGYRPRFPSGFHIPERLYQLQKFYAFKPSFFFDFPLSWHRGCSESIFQPFSLMHQIQSSTVSHSTVRSELFRKDFEYNLSQETKSLHQVCYPATPRKNSACQCCHIPLPQPSGPNKESVFQRTAKGIFSGFLNHL